MDKNEFSERLFKLRRDKGLSQKDLGDLLGVSNKAISKWENGEAMPKTETMLKLAELLGIDGNELLGIYSAPEPDESFTKELDRLKSENLALQEKIDAQAKNKKRWLVTAFITFAVALSVIALCFCISQIKSNKKYDFADAGKTGTKIIFNGTEYLPCSENGNALLGFNRDSFYADSEKNAKFIASDGSETGISVEGSTEYKIVRLKTKQGDFYYIDKEFSLAVTPSNLGYISVSYGSIANNGNYIATGFMKNYASTVKEENTQIKIFCDYYNNLNSPADKKITELYLGRNGKTVTVSFKGGFLPALKVGEFFESDSKELYFYNYADGKAYPAGEELNTFVSR